MGAAARFTKFTKSSSDIDEAVLDAEVERRTNMVLEVLRGKSAEAVASRYRSSGVDISTGTLEVLVSRFLAAGRDELRAMAPTFNPKDVVSEEEDGGGIKS